jgi:hypothetical protein
VDKAYIDSRIEATEARTDLKLGQFATKSTVWGAAGSIIGAMAVLLTILLAVLALSANRFDAGMTVRSSVDAATAGQKGRDDAQDAKLAAINDKLDVLIAGQKSPPKK